MPLTVSYAHKKDAHRNAKTQIKQQGHSQRHGGSGFTFKWASSWLPEIQPFVLEGDEVSPVHPFSDIVEKRYRQLFELQACIHCNDKPGNE